MDNEQLRDHFKANMLDGDEMQDGQMIASTEVWEYLQDIAKAIELAARIDENDRYWNMLVTGNWRSFGTEVDERLTKLKALQKEAHHE